MLLQIKEIKVSYGGVKALRGISLDVQEGEIISLLGGNGAGKSTLVNTICGFVRPTSGKILYKGEDITGMPPHQIVQKGIVQCPEGRGIFAIQTVLENLKIGAYLTKSKEEVEKSLDMVFKLFPVLEERTNQVGGSLSGGEQQMLAIGRALMAKPQLLVMDEPTLGLAPLIRKEVGEIAQKINQMGTSVILVEQDANMALRIARRGFVLQNGEIVMQGMSSDLLNDPLLRESYLA